MTVHRHLDFSVPDWRELAGPPIAWQPYVARVMSLDPVLYYRLGETSGTAVHDQTGAASAAAALGNVQRGQAGALHRDADGATGLDGHSGYLNIPRRRLLDGATAASFTFWMRYDAPAVTRDGGVLSRGTAWQMWVDHHGFLTGRHRTFTVAFSEVAGSGYARIEGSSDLVRPGVWDFFTVTFLGSDTLSLYRNGQLDRQTPVTFPAIAAIDADHWIGRVAGHVGLVQATFDEVAFFDHALTPSQILDLYQAGRGILRPSTAE